MADVDWTIEEITDKICDMYTIHLMSRLLRVKPQIATNPEIGLDGHSILDYLTRRVLLVRGIVRSAAYVAWNSKIDRQNAEWACINRLRVERYLTDGESSKIWSLVRNQFVCLDHWGIPYSDSESVGADLGYDVRLISEVMSKTGVEGPRWLT